MSSEKEISVAQKAAMYDLISILEKSPNKAYTVEELKKIIAAYLAGAQQ